MPNGDAGAQRTSCIRSSIYAHIYDTSSIGQNGMLFMLLLLAAAASVAVAAVRRHCRYCHRCLVQQQVGGQKVKFSLQRITFVNGLIRLTLSCALRYLFKKNKIKIQSKKCERSLCSIYIKCVMTWTFRNSLRIFLVGSFR